MKHKVIFTFILFFFCVNFCFAADDLRTQFLNNDSVICSINIRNFNAKDTNNNGFIDENEISGNFINAVERLDELKELHINTLHILPITPVGKLKALGTAGSLYAIADFTSINPQLIDYSSPLKPKEQAKYFISECHKRGIKVIIDLPSCGSYDLFLTHPEYFVKDENQLSIVPTDWTDVRLFNTGHDDSLNQDLIDVHKRFIDMAMDLGADGIRADVATIKPFEFWKEIIDYTRSINDNFLYLAEASDSWREPPSEYAEFTPYDKLLEAGFDGYYGSFFNLKDWKNSKDLYNHIKFNEKLLTSYPDKKSVILSFTTHDEVSPIILYGENFAEMIMWLDATLPYNPYFPDGFQYGDSYIYPLENTKAKITETDDDYYFVHHGKLDIFNYSRRPDSYNKSLKETFKKAMNFRTTYTELIKDDSFNILKCDKEDVFAYSRELTSTNIIVIGNLNHKKKYKHITIKVPNLKKSYTVESVCGNIKHKIIKNKIITDLEAGEIKVLRINNFSL